MKLKTKPRWFKKQFFKRYGRKRRIRRDEQQAKKDYACERNDYIEHWSNHIIPL